MRKGLTHGGYKSASHQPFKDKAKNRVDDLQGIFMDLQSARKESRSVDAAVLEEQVYQMLREWKSELNEPSPATSLHNNDTLGSFSSDIYRLLQLHEEEDDATSSLGELTKPKAEPDVQTFQAVGTGILKEKMSSGEEETSSSDYHPDDEEVTSSSDGYIEEEEVAGEDYGTESDASSETEEAVGIDFSIAFHYDGVWNYRREMLDWARQIAVSKNFVLVIKNSNPNRVILTCDLAGKYRCGKRVLPGAEIRSIYKPRTDTPTRKCGCPFELIGVRIKDKNGWVLKVKCGQHNHGLANSLVAHPYAGRLTAEQKEFVKEKFLYLASPKMVLQELRAKYPGNVTSIRQIYNMREKLILEDCGELTVTQWSLKFLKDRGYIVYPRRVSGSDVMNVLFFVHPTGLRMLKMFPYVVIMDSTYKTNRYDMPLLEMVGFTCTGNTFNIGFAFMSNENVSSYRWVLSQLKYVYDELGVQVNAIVTDREQALIKAIRQVFGDGVQHLLCWVHIRHKILAYGLKVFANTPDPSELSSGFANACWVLFSSTTEATFEERYRELKERWRPTLIAYLEKVWLKPYKKSIVRAWTDHTLHFQTRTTNRVEGMHSVLKKILNSSRGGFNTVILRIHIQMESQTNTLRTAIEKSKIELPTKLKSLSPRIRALFRPLRNKVSMQCLGQLIDMFYDLVLELQQGRVQDECDDYFWRECHGLPCKHRVGQAVIRNYPIRLDEIHSFWQQLEWDGLADDDQLVLACVPLSIEDVTWNTMVAKHSRGDMPRDQLFQITSAFNDYVDPEETTLIELTRYETPVGPNKYSTTRDKTHLEYMMDEYEKEQQRRKDNEWKNIANKSASSLPRGRPRGSRNKKGTVDAIPPFAAASPATAAPPVDATPPVGSNWGPPTCVVWHGVNFGIRNVDSFMFPYIDDARDVMGDGHCGFRSLAEVLGRQQTEYYSIRWELQGELIRNRDIYEVLTPWGLTSFEDLLENIGHVESPCSSRYWLRMPLHGLIFSTFYQVPLVLLSKDRGSHTCLPLRIFGSNQGHGIPPSVVAIALVGRQDHFIPVWLMKNAPIPPPPAAWYTFHDTSVEYWFDALNPRIEHWKMCRRRAGLHPETYA